MLKNYWSGREIRCGDVKYFFAFENTTYDLELVSVQELTDCGTRCWMGKERTAKCDGLSGWSKPMQKKLDGGPN